MEDFEKKTSFVKDDKEGRFIKVLFAIIQFLNTNLELKSMEKYERAEIADQFDDQIASTQFNIRYESERDRFYLTEYKTYEVTDLRYQ